MATLFSPGALALAPARTSRPRILFSVNAAWNVINFRTGLIRRLLAEGYDVTVATPADPGLESKIEDMGCRYAELPMQPHGRSPLADSMLLLRYLRIMRAERPDFFLGFTAKPNIYGSMAAALNGIPRINNIAGLGQVFNEHGLTNRVLKLLYKVALRGSRRVFFQNSSDRQLFLHAHIAQNCQSGLLPGSGVDLAWFQPEPLRDAARPMVFLLAARLLWQKGVAELIDAARMLHARGLPVEVRLIGFIDPGNPASVQAADLEKWQADGLAVHLGATSDVRPHLQDADCVVLPSFYPEGTPRILLEAAATGRPIITCDMPGCRDVVAEGENGYLVPPRDAAALAEAMAKLSQLPRTELCAMGRQSRVRAEALFDEAIVIDRYIEALNDAPAPGAAARG